MNIKIRFILVFVFTSVALSTQAQNELFGKWKGTCPIERMSEASIEHCLFCHISSSKGGGMMISDFELTINHANMTVNMMDELTIINYQWDESIHGISFDFKNLHFDFKVLGLLQDDVLILKTTDGAVILLERVKG